MVKLGRNEHAAMLLMFRNQHLTALWALRNICCVQIPQGRKRGRYLVYASFQRGILQAKWATITRTPHSAHRPPNIKHHESDIINRR